MPPTSVFPQRGVFAFFPSVCFRFVCAGLARRICVLEPTAGPALCMMCVKEPVLALRPWNPAEWDLHWRSSLCPCGDVVLAPAALYGCALGRDRSRTISFSWQRGLPFYALHVEAAPFGRDTSCTSCGRDRQAGISDCRRAVAAKFVRGVGLNMLRIASGGMMAGPMASLCAIMTHFVGSLHTLVALERHGNGGGRGGYAW